MKCNFCPRGCSERSSGFCGVGDRIVVSRAAPHRWEEPCVSGERGSGTVFFSGCNLKCIFCQNRDISFRLRGEQLTCEELAQKCFELVNTGVHNLNFVTPTPYIGVLAELLSTYDFGVPIVYNTGSYETVTALRKLNSLVDVYLADIKFYDSNLSQAYTGIGDYFDTAMAALEEMYRQVGDVQLSEDGTIERGVIVRHLVLPGCTEDTKDIIDRFCEFSRGKRVLFSLMSQYTPCVHSSCYKNLNRRLTEEEYKEVSDYLMLCGADGYLQELSSADDSYIPVFNTSSI